MKLIVTDLTRFREGNTDVCVAGIENSGNGQCIRPMPYLKKSEILKLSIVPGEILSGTFRETDITPPHYEDMSYDNLNYEGACSSEEFENVLQKSVFPSLREGFDNKIILGTRLIPYNSPPDRSIITLSLPVRNLQILLDNWKNIKIHLTDNDGTRYRYMPITDLGFYLYSKFNSNNPNLIDDLNNFIWNQENLYLRVGLSRVHMKNPNENGFWLQVNGIYTFPNYHPRARCYDY